MSFFTKLLPFTAQTEADVVAAVKKVNDKAAADVAALLKSHAASKASADKAAKVAAFKAALADYKARLDGEVVAAPPPTPPTPTV